MTPDQMAELAARLREHAKPLRRSGQMTHDHIADDLDLAAALLDRLDKAERENERLREDAERIEWLTKAAQMGSKHSTGYVLMIEVPISQAHFLAFSNDDLRAAIDAARAAEQSDERRDG